VIVGITLTFNLVFILVIFVASAVELKKTPSSVGDKQRQTTTSLDERGGDVYPRYFIVRTSDKGLLQPSVFLLGPKCISIVDG
jgi:hypothetical protein